jgi:ADP-ribose pyrophosphatase YjhB (NUDIX family)
MQPLYLLRRLMLRLLRLRTRGVKVMVFNPAGELLLIRNSYGARGLFVLPGGGIGRRESPDAAALREVEEEIGIRLDGLVPAGVFGSTAEGKRDTIHLFTAVTEAEPRIDAVEVEEARFFPLDALPDKVSTATLRRLAEQRGEREVDGRW